MRQLVAIYLFCGSAFALTLTWEKCVDEAKKNNPEWVAVQHRVQAADYQVSGQYSSFLPQVNGSLGYQKEKSDSPAGSVSSYSAGLSANWNLFSGLQDRARLKQAEANYDSAEADRQAVAAKLGRELRTAYANARFAQEFADLSDRIIERRSTNLKLVDLRLHSGRENRGSLLLSRANLEQAKLEKLRATNSIPTATADLARLLGMDKPERIVVMNEIPTKEPPGQMDFTGVVEKTPAYRKAVASLESAEQAVTIAYAGFFPSINLTGSTSNFDDQFFPDNNRWSVGLSLTIPLFVGGKDYYSIKSALDLSKSAQLTRANLLRDSVTQLLRALFAFREANQRFRVDTTFRDAAIMRAKIAREKYNTGLLSFEDWDVIENDLINREKSFLEAQRDRVIAEAVWEETQGNGVFP